LAISKAVQAEILRYHFVEQWRVGTIATQLGVHHSVVDRVLSQAGLPKAERTDRASIIDPFLPFIIDTLKQYPKLTAARLYDMVKVRGYPGGPSHFRQRIAQLRPRPQPEAYLRLRTLPGEQSQVDWGHFGHIEIGRARRPLMAFVMVLSWSRQIFLRFYLNQQMENFLRGHIEAFEFFQGQCRVLLYDNLKSAVLERRGDAIRFHPTLLELSAHYRFQPRPVAVARGNEKGRVERAIRYIRDNFFAARAWQDLDDLNAQARAWCVGQSADRRCPEDPSLTVREAFSQEQSHLLALPDNPFPAEEWVAVSAGKTPYVRFDLNDYSIPHDQVRRPLTVRATSTRVTVQNGLQVVAQHRRCYGKAEQIEDPAHIDALLESKQQARHHRGQDRLARAAPSSQSLLVQAAERGNRLSTTVSLLVQLLDDYGAVELEIAIAEALQQQVPHPNAVRQVLERRREQRRQPPPIAIALPDHPQANTLVVRPASLALYDQLNDHEAEDTPPAPSSTTGGQTHDETD
jgi:transposase